MREDFLHYVWQYSLFDFKDCKTSDREDVAVLFAGNYNTNSGPDFLYSQLKINNQIWVGNVEIHLKSSDWYAHHHQTDQNYDAVILHVVYEHDTIVYMKNNKPLPTLVLKDLIDKQVYNEYKKLLNQKTHWIACERQLPNLSQIIWKNWLKQLYFERLEQKSVLIRELLLRSNHNFEEVLFKLLIKNFGLKVNSDAFLNLANSLDFSILRKESFNEQKLEALLFGQAGFLEDDIESFHYKKLKQEYVFMKHKYSLNGITKNQFQFFRMRPNNFPTIRLAQLVAIFSKHQNLFSKLMKFSDPKKFYEVFSVKVNTFWEEHYTFETSSRKTVKKLTKSFIDLLIINTVVPLKYVYLQSIGKNHESDVLNLMNRLPPEKNAIISKFSVLNIKAKNAFESQALLQLKKEYCTSKFCLKCAVGTNLLQGKH